VRHETYGMVHARVRQLQPLSNHVIEQYVLFRPLLNPVVIQLGDMRMKRTDRARSSECACVVRGFDTTDKRDKVCSILGVATEEIPWAGYQITHCLLKRSIGTRRPILHDETTAYGCRFLLLRA
jgi:hypothetical protein